MCIRDRCYGWIDSVSYRLDEDFFELGGNSLVAVQLAVRIRDHFLVNVPGIAVLEYPTVRLLAEFIDSSRAQRAEG